MTRGRKSATVRATAGRTPVLRMAAHIAKKLNKALATALAFDNLSLLRFIA